MTDDREQQWICLTKYCDTGRKDLNVEKLSVWAWLYAYFMTRQQADEFKSCAEKGLPIISSDTASHHDTYTVFNREYPWSPSCVKFENGAWVEASVKTGETIIETVQVPDFSPLDELLRKYGVITDDADKTPEEELLDEKEAGDITDDLRDFKLSEGAYKEETRQREVVRKIGSILHATTDLLWEEEYDATKEETISRSFPCGELIATMKLHSIRI